ncbi:MAG TPA: hypothetical protein PLQ13_00105 [Candidatus Krumholzibacteria bacterium]|nr:hypothetical protein [Candidatus Krumholzibacteria bacterium]
MPRHAPLRLLAALLCLAAAAPAAASTARLAALGGDGFYLDDPAAARTWYGALGDHPDWVAVESGAFMHDLGYPRSLVGGGRAAGPAAGLHWAIGEGGRSATVGLWWNDRANAGGIGELGADELDTSWQVMAAHPFGKVTGAVSLRHAGAERDLNAYVHRDAIRDDFGLGLRWSVSTKAYLDVAGEIVRLEDRSHVGGDEPVTRSTADSWGARARAFVQVGDGLVLTPVLERRTENRSWSAVATDADRSWRLWRVGAGLTWLPDPDHLVLLAADFRDAGEYRDRDTDHELSATASVVDLRVAFEARVHALLSLRLASGYRATRAEIDGVAAYDLDQVPLSAGVAVHAGPADLELSLANLPPVGPDGLREPWWPNEIATWLNAGLNWWF